MGEARGSDEGRACLADIGALKQSFVSETQDNLVSIGVSKHCGNRVSTNPHNLDAATNPNSVNIRSCGLPATLYVALNADNSISCSSGL